MLSDPASKVAGRRTRPALRPESDGPGVRLINFEVHDENRRSEAESLPGPMLRLPGMDLEPASKAIAR
jgi:hypothetical protein